MNSNPGAGWPANLRTEPVKSAKRFPPLSRGQGRIRAARAMDRQGIPRAQIAARLGISRRFLYRIMNGKWKVNDERALRKFYQTATPRHTIRSETIGCSTSC